MHKLQKYVHKSKSSREQRGINNLHQQEAESNKLQKLPLPARENLNFYMYTQQNTALLRSLLSSVFLK